MARDVFISHSHEDASIGDALCTKLEAAGIRCWIAPRDILPGLTWQEAIIDGIHDAAVMVVVFSSHANESVHVLREVERADSRGIPILPFRVEDVAPSKALAYYLGTSHWFDALTAPLDQHIGRLIGNVQELIARRTQGQSLPAATPSGAATPHVPAAARRGRRELRVAAATGGALATLLLVGTAVALRRQSAEPELDPKRVIIPPFENETNDSTLNRLAVAATDWVTRGLTQTGLVDVVDTRSFPRADSAKQGEPRFALAHEAGAGTLVLGSVYRRGDSVEFQVAVADANRREIVRSPAPVMAPVTRPDAGFEALRQRVIGALATVVDSALNPYSHIASQPPSWAAYQEFIQARESISRGDYGEGLRHEYRAAALDSDFTLPLVVAASLHANMGDCNRADSLDRAIDGRAVPVAPYDRYSMARIVRSCHGDWEGAYEAVVELHRLVPRSERVAFLVGEHALYAGRPGETVRVLSPLHPDRGDLRYGVGGEYYLALGQALHLVGNYARERQVAERGVAQYPNHLDRLAELLRAMAALRRDDDVRSQLDQTLALPASGEGWTPGRLMVAAAEELEAHGRTSAAHLAWRRAVDWYQKQPADKLDGLQRLFEVEALIGAGQFGEARALVDPVLAKDSSHLDGLGLMGVIAARQGRRAEAARMLQRLGARADSGYALAHRQRRRAEIAASLGDRDQAVDLLRDAFSKGLQYGALFHADPYFASLRGYPPFVALLKPKG